LYGPQLPLLAEVTHAVPCAVGADCGADGALDGAVDGALGILLGDEIGEGADDGAELGSGLAGDACPDCAVHRTGTDLVGHFGAVATDRWVNLPPPGRRKWSRSGRMRFPARGPGSRPPRCGYSLAHGYYPPPHTHRRLRPPSGPAQQPTVRVSWVFSEQDLWQAAPPRLQTVQATRNRPDLRQDPDLRPHRRDPLGPRARSRLKGVADSDGAASWTATCRTRSTVRCCCPRRLR